MSDKIKAAYDADPAAGNDPSQEGYVAVGVGGIDAIGHSYTQVASIVANRLGISENLPDQATFSARFPDNSLIATVDPIQTAYKYYVINTTGTTPSSGGTTGALAFTAADWELYTYYLFISDDDSAYTQVEPSANDVNNDGLDPPGLVLQANDTLPPTEVTDITYSSISTATATLSFTAATDSGSGVKQHNLINNDSGVTEQSDITSPVSLAGLVPDTTYSYQIQVLDNTNPSNVSLTEDPASFKTTALAGGVITLLEPTAVTEGNNQTWTATRSGGTAGAASVDFVTPGYSQDTAINGTNYTDPGTLTFSWADGVGGDDTVTVATIDTSSIENNAYQGELVPGSESGVSLGVDIAQFGKINGTGGASDLYPETLVSGSTYRAVINAVNFSSKSSDGATAFVLDSSNGDTTIADVMVQPVITLEGTGITGNLTYLRFKVNVHASADGDDHYIWMRSKGASTTRNTSFGGTGGVDSMTPATPIASVAAGASTYEWDEVRSSGGTQALVALSAGEHTIEVYYKEPLHYVSQILVVNQPKATYTPAAAEITESTPSSADPTDNLNNPTVIVPPGDDASPVGYSSISPASAATNVSLTTSIRITYSGSDLYMNEDGVVLSYNAGADIVTLSSITVDSATNTAIITPSAPLPQNEAIKVEIGTGSAHGGTTVINGVRETLTNENYSFTTLATGSFLFDFDFSSEVVGTVIDSATVLKSIFDNANGIAPTVSSATKGNWSIANDPAPNPTRGNVLKIDFLKDTYGNGKTLLDPDAGLPSAGQFNWDLNSREQELYFAYDIFIPITQIDHLENKLPGFRGTGGTPDPANPEGWGDVAMYCYSIWTGNRGPLTASGYSTRGAQNRVKNYWTLSDPSDEDTGEQYYWGKGFWITVEQHVKNNSTYDPGNAVIENWINDPRPVADGGTDGLNQLVFTETGRQFHLAPATPLASGWNVLWFGFYIGGTGTEYLIKADTSLYLTNFKLSTSRIYS